MGIEAGVEGVAGAAPAPPATADRGDVDVVEEEGANIPVDRTGFVVVEGSAAEVGAEE